MRNPLFRALMVVALGLILHLQITAQNVASITGVVSDQSGAVIPNVSVTLQNTQTGANYTTISNAVGSYTLNEVKPGPGYKIEFTRDGFKPFVVSGIYMNIDATRTQNARLSVGTAAQTVEVSAASDNVTLDTTDATVGNSFQVQSLNDLPIENRDSPAALFTQQPGVTLDGAVTGARVDQSNVSLDGLEVNDNGTGNFGAIVANAPVDSVQEFRGVSAGPLSSAGEGGGGQFELATRGGSNQFHGALVEYHRDTDTQANDWFNNNNGTPRPPLIRNQFGGNVGGPILKDKVFFFFDWNSRRDTLSNLVEHTVPLDSYRAGNVSYKNSAGAIETLSPAQVTALDPLGIGFNSSVLNVFNSRYPKANDLSGNFGDLINTGGIRFNAPFPFVENDYVQRVDYNLNSKMKIFGVGHIAKQNSTQAAIQFPGDPETFPFLDNSYSWAVGHTWSINSNMVNQAEYGETFEDYSFPNTFNPTGVNQFGTFGGNGTGGAILGSPYASAINAQARTYPVPLVRDDFSWQKGKHGITIGGTFKWESPDGNTILDYNSPTLGLGGYTLGLNPSLRPTDIGKGSSTSRYDSAFALALAPYSVVNATYNYDAKGNPVPQGTGAQRDYRYYESELYIGDTWKVTTSLTISAGLRYQNFTVPYEVHGLESIQNLSFEQYFEARNAQSQAGVSGNTALPFQQYTLGGKANNAPGYFQPANKNFAPRLAFAYSPGFDRKSVLSGGAGIIYDHTVVNAVQYQQSQNSYLFQSAAPANLFGTPGDPVASLKTDPRFSGFTTVPPASAAPAITTPFVPFVSGTGANAVPFGTEFGQFNTTVDPQLKTPYSIQYNFGLQHEFPQGYLLRTTYVGRLGRRLLAQADASQLIDFPDKASGQLMSQAFASITQQIRSGIDPTQVTAQPWFENVLAAGAGQQFGFNNNTQLVAAGFAPFPLRGDFADTIQQLASIPGLLPPNVGLASQYADNNFFTSKGFSNYNGLLVTLHKNAGYGLQFDLNYTWSHSIDNVSLVANSNASAGYGFVCDVNRPRECRANSDFDVANYLNGDFLYELPVGRGKSFANTAPFWLNELIGGWAVSGVPSWHTGNAYFAASNAFVAGFANDAPATLTGPISDVKTHITGGKGVAVNAYTNSATALNDYTGPVGFNIGSRNNLRGPGFFNLDLGVAKSFPIYGERVHLKFRADAFNALNHPSFNVPTTGTDITESTIQFGTIQSTASTARVLQGALRLEF